MYFRYAEEAGLVVDMVIDAGWLLARRVGGGKEEETS
jgi:hypothetical protein